MQGGMHRKKTRKRVKGYLNKSLKCSMKKKKKQVKVSITDGRETLQGKALRTVCVCVWHLLATGSLINNREKPGLPES